MKTAEEKILTAQFEHALNVSMSQLRVAMAHVAPVVVGLHEGSADHRYLVNGLIELNNLHGYLTQQLMSLLTGIEDPEAAGRALLKGAKETIESMPAEPDKKVPLDEHLFH